MRVFAPVTVCLALAAGVSPIMGQGMRIATGSAVAPAGAQVIRVPASQLANGVVPANVRAAQSASVDSLLNGYPAPGLGFDYTHNAAVNRNLATRALIDPITQQRLDQAIQLRRNSPQVPIAIPAVVNNIQIVVVAPPPVIILPVADAADDTPHRQRRRDDDDYRRWMNERYAATLREPQEAAAPPAEPPREVSELVLIRRDGTLLFAVGYTLRGDRIIYITREGHRNSLPLEVLDLDATRAMNESLGTTLNL